MPFKIPIELDVLAADQAEIDGVEMEMLGAIRTPPTHFNYSAANDYQPGYVTFGCFCSPVNPGVSLQVQWGYGQIFNQGWFPFVKAGNTSAIAADATYPRFYLLVADTTGAVTLEDGGAGANPIFPRWSTFAVNRNKVVLCAIYIPAGATSITAANIIDKRVFGSNALDAYDDFDFGRLSSGSVGRLGWLYGGNVSPNFTLQGSVFYVECTNGNSYAYMKAGVNFIHKREPLRFKACASFYTGTDKRLKIGFSDDVTVNTTTSLFWGTGTGNAVWFEMYNGTVYCCQQHSNVATNFVAGTYSSSQVVDLELVVNSSNQIGAAVNGVVSANSYSITNVFAVDASYQLMTSGCSVAGVNAFPFPSTGIRYLGLNYRRFDGISTY